MSQLQTWASPGEAADMVFDVRASGVTALGYALLRPRSRGRDNSVATLAYAKLNPIQPGDPSSRTRCGMPVSARDHRLVLAAGVADPTSLARLFGDYDAATPDNQRLLAAVLTIPFDRDRPLHDQFDCAVAFSVLNLARARRLTTLAVLHSPGDQAAYEAPHAHLLVLGRTQHASGWGSVHADLAEDRHEAWADEWTRFAESWQRLLSG